MELPFCIESSRLLLDHRLFTGPVQTTRHDGRCNAESVARNLGVRREFTGHAATADAGAGAGVTRLATCCLPPSPPTVVCSPTGGE